ncbi:hypothetical protein WJX79_005797 [Trebouxia sp. C0005]|nr:MAG: carboxymethylenebutenolidase (ISS) [Trebouxia sp. A1-2]
MSAGTGLSKISFGNNIPGWATAVSKSPAVIVLQEWWGVTDEIKRQAQYLHEQKGYRVLIPDLYKGKLGVDAEEAGHLMGNLDFPQAVEEIKQAAKWLKEQGAPKVGCMGFCMGGALSFLAGQEADVDAIAPFYGTPDPKLAKPEQIKIPVQCHDGEEDAMEGLADPKTVKEFIEKVKANGNKDVTLYMYSGEGHGFMNGGQDIHKMMKTGGLPIGSTEAQKTAWGRVFDFFGKNL